MIKLRLEENWKKQVIRLRLCVTYLTIMFFFFLTLVWGVDLFYSMIQTKRFWKNLLRLLGVEILSDTLAPRKNNLPVVCSQIFFIPDTGLGGPPHPLARNDPWLCLCFLWGPLRPWGRFLGSNHSKHWFFMNEHPIAAVTLSLRLSTSKFHFLSI